MAQVHNFYGRTKYVTQETKKVLAYLNRLIFCGIFCFLLFYSFLLFITLARPFWKGGFCLQRVSRDGKIEE
jgi:hypothetical protein